MILIINCIIDEKEKNNFDKNTVSHIKTLTDRKVETVHITNLKNISNLENMNYLIVSGSELSAAEKNEWDEDLTKVINFFVDNKKAVLGICYGHQMMARALLNENACRKAKIPEFGWKTIKLPKNPIFENLDTIKVAQSHFDEVCNLTEDFKILASSENCKIQAFQYKNLPVWGVQFHPELTWEAANKMFEDNVKDNELIAKLFNNETENPKDVEQNSIIIKNFLNGLLNEEYKS